MLISNHRGSAILIAMLVLTLVTVMSAVFFEKIKYFSEASNGIENSNVAYYKALGVIENSLFTGTVNKYTPWNISNAAYGSSMSSGVNFIVNTGANSVPALGKGNSPYDADYNIIALGEPVQLVIPENITWTNIYFNFRVPRISVGTSTGVLGGGGSNTGFILWTFASSGASLFASGETNIFQGNALDNSNQGIATKNGTSNSGSSSTFDNFYTNINFLGPNGVKCTNYQCTLKLSLIRPIPIDDGRNVNFLEYKITGFGSAIPSQYMILSADGYAYGFMRNRTIRFPQITTNTALDFAVLQ